MLRVVYHDQRKKAHVLSSVYFGFHGANVGETTCIPPLPTQQLLCAAYTDPDQFGHHHQHCWPAESNSGATTINAIRRSDLHTIDRLGKQYDQFPVLGHSGCWVHRYGSSGFGRPNHGSALSVSSVDLDIEGGGRIDENYDAGLPWPFGGSGLGDILGGRGSYAAAWSAKGPAENIPRLSAGQSLRCHLAWARHGWWDANRWSDAFQLIASSREIRNGVIKGLLLSGTISALVFFFELAFFPKVLFQRPDKVAHDIASSAGSTGSLVGSLGNVFWLYPLIGGSYLLASSWTADIAQAAFKLRHGHARNLSLANASLPPGTSRRLLQESYRMILIINYTIVYLLLGQVPYLGRWLSFLFMCMVDGYYCFEQVWISRGWSLERRMRYCEERWSYFVAFGLPSTAVSFFHPSGLLNLMLFMLVFPFCAVLAMLANPQPRISASGAAAASTGYGSAGSGLDVSAPLSRLVPSRLPIFWPTIQLHRLVLKTLPTLAEVPFDATSQAYERAAAASSYGRGATGLVAGGFANNGGFGGGFATQGKTAARMVGGIFGASQDPISNSGRASPANWPAPRDAVVQQQQQQQQQSVYGSTVDANGFASQHTYSSTGTYSNPNQNIHARTFGAAAQSKPPLAPPPKGPAANHRKND
ncbi:hypothetical protein BCV70DRAFT_220190 [Testicularia cyperi]|uniref:EI24-domain-containing protein n=1 Tax=Testicularia cyperi TaxID=1882483 RepID=A0A317XXZ7_9BASI|nr:hypothetical protein BCV70DRAFT_220190 [Testicularia cyperi]